MVVSNGETVVVTVGVRVVASTVLIIAGLGRAGVNPCLCRIRAEICSMVLGDQEARVAASAEE